MRPGGIPSSGPAGWTCGAGHGDAGMAASRGPGTPRSGSAMPSAARGGVLMTRHEAELAVVGAGPGGVAAAVAAADRGVATAVIDAAAQPGGQYYRRPAAELRA